MPPPDAALGAGEAARRRLVAAAAPFLPVVPPALLLVSIAWGLGAPGTVLGRWFLVSALAPERVLPLVGLALALAPGKRADILAAFALFALGAWLGWNRHAAFLASMAAVPHAGEHLFLTGPIALLAAGLLLLVPGIGTPRRAALPALALGLLHAVAMRLTDPTLHDPRVAPLGVLAAALVLAASLAMARAAGLARWPVAGRIAGSWLVAIAILHGAATLAPRRAPDLPAAPPPSALPSIPSRANPFAGDAAEALFPENPAGGFAAPFGAGGTP